MIKQLRFDILILLVLLCAIPEKAQSQSYHFRKYSVEQGLPFVQVFTIYQDDKGYLWSGGYGGLSRYDGFDFKNYSPLNGLPNHYVNAIAGGEDHSMWVGTIEGLAVLRNDIFTTYTTADGLPSDYINCLLRDERNNLYAGTRKGLARYNSGHFDNIVIDPQFPDLEVLCFFQEPNTNNLWIGTGEGVYLFSNGKFTRQRYPEFYDNNIRSINKDRNGRIVAGCYDGLFILENGLFRQFITPESTVNPVINAMITDISGVLWIGASNGLFSFDGKSFQTIKVSNDPNSQVVRSLYNDFENNVWLGTHAGLMRFRGKGFQSYGVHDGLMGNFIFGITKDKNDNLWLCSDTRGVFRYDGTTFHSYTRKDGMPSDVTNSALANDDGSVFIGTQKGLVLFRDNKVSKVYNTKDGLNHDSVNVLFRDADGTIWTGGNTGISKMDGERFIPYSIKWQGTRPDVWSMFRDSQNRLWVGTYLGGLYRFENGLFTQVNRSMGITADSYFRIEEDKAGKLYFATLDGVYVWDGNKLDSIREQHGLNSDLVYSMTIDREKNFLWIGTNQGLNKFDISEYNKSGKKQIYTFGKEEGFSGVECNTNGMYEDNDGVMWFGTVNGLMRYNPVEYRDNPYYTKTNIRKTYLFYNDTVLPQNAILNYTENSISFEYVGICLTNPVKVRYRYMLEGFEKEFSPPTTERIARYSNLPPGTYKFKVISCNNEGLWNDVPAEFSFTISTPFWKKSWFWLLVSVGAMIILTVAIFTRIRRIKERERKEAEVRVALAGNELKALRAQMNPHFVFNSLNSIQHFILTNKSGDAGKYLNKFARLMRVILNNSEKSVITIKEELEYLTLYIELEAMRFDNKFEWKIDISDDIDTEYFEIPAMLLQPYVENAILHGLTPKGEGGLLEIIMRLQGNNLLCRIRDNGIGREKSREMRQLSKRKDHKSLGMKITSDRLELINNLQGSHLSMTVTDLRNEDGTPAGTQVDIFIPVS
ncbi:MAG: histidine kinase [Bacteroidia bacterium]|nr:histidine kinase [Bacteroidia bacterium]